VSSPRRGEVSRYDDRHESVGAESIALAPEVNGRGPRPGAPGARPGGGAKAPQGAASLRKRGPWRSWRTPPRPC